MEHLDAALRSKGMEVYSRRICRSNATFLSMKSNAHRQQREVQPTCQVHLSKLSIENAIKEGTVGGSETHEGRATDFGKEEILSRVASASRPLIMSEITMNPLNIEKKFMSSIDGIASMMTNEVKHKISKGASIAQHNMQDWLTDESYDDELLDDIEEAEWQT